MNTGAPDLKELLDFTVRLSEEAMETIRDA